jgi:hypothetical protein
VQHTQDAYNIADNTLRDDIGRSTDDEFTRAFNAARVASIGKLRKQLDLLADAIIHGDGSPWVVLLDVIENPVTVIKRKLRSLKPHVSPSAAFRSAAARRLAKCAST